MAGNLPIQTHSGLIQYKRALPGNISKKNIINMPGLFRQYSDSYPDAIGAQFAETASGHQRIWILQRRHYTGHLLPDNQIRAGRCLPVMRTGFKTYIQCCPFRIFRGAGKCIDFRVRTTILLVPAFPDNTTILDQNSPYHGIRSRMASSAKGQL